MQVRVLMHGVLIRLAGNESVTIDCQPGDSVQDLLEKLANRMPSLAQELERTACAVGDALVSRDTLLKPATELVLIPPVSGG